MTTPRRKPVHVARIGTVRVPVSRHTAGRWVVTWREIERGPRKRETFAVKVDAIRRAEEIAAAIAGGRGDVVTLSSADRDHYRHAVLALAPLGVSLHAAIEEYTTARALTGPVPLVEALGEWKSQRTLAAQKCAIPPSAEILTHLLDVTRANGRSATHRERLRQRLAPFCVRWPDLSTVTQRDIFTWLGEKLAHGQPISPRTRDNHRDALAQLFRFARSNKWLPDGKTAPEEVPSIATGGEICTYTPAEFETMLRYFAARDRAWLPLVAIGGFAGLRITEILRLDWSAFHWEAGAIAVHRTIARKVRRSRLVPMCPALQSWLAEWQNATGPLYPGPTERAVLHRQFRAVIRFKKATGLEWRDNALRHSFGSYRVADVKSLDQVAIEMGNSPKMVRENYNSPQFAADAAKWFAILPLPGTANIIHLHENR